MCGIVGVFSLEGKDVDPSLVKAMNGMIHHRGPNEDGEWFEDGIGMAMKRLSILDIAGGSQPVFNETRQIVAVYNGEIYNFPQLKATLQRNGHTLNTNCDSELLPHLYEDHHSQMVNHLRGMFAFALFDRAKNSLILARDRLGEKPLYYSVQQGNLYFASELKAFKPAGLLQQRSDQALYYYFTDGYIPAPYTIYQNIFKLPPGHFLMCRHGKIEIERYWTFNYKEQFDAGDESQILDSLGKQIKEAVKMRLISDVPLGAFLSGGVDSSLIVAMMAECASKVKTFSIACQDDEYDESPFAAEVAKHFATDHTVLTVTPDLFDNVPTIIGGFDEPFADPSAIPTYFLSKLTREHVTVALSGDGGDELFAGYHRYKHFMNKTPFYRIPLSIRRALCGPISGLMPNGMRGKRFIRSLTLDPFDDYIFGAMEFWHEHIFEQAYLESLEDIKARDPGAQYLDKEYPSDGDKICGYDIGIYLPDDILAKVDRTSMANSLETRIPLLDHELVEYATRIPLSLKIKNGTSKYILKKVLENYLPRRLIHRPKKGFGIPIGKWLRNEIKDQFIDVIASLRTNQGIFNYATIDTLIDQHMKGLRDHQGLLWRIYVFASWQLNHNSD